MSTEQAFRPSALTRAQRRALGELYRATVPRSPRSIFTRRDVLWRLEERGMVGRNIHDQWHIRPAGVAAYEAMWEANEHPQRTDRGETAGRRDL